MMEEAKVKNYKLVRVELAIQIKTQTQLVIVDQSHSFKDKTTSTTLSLKAISLNNHKLNSAPVSIMRKSYMSDRLQISHRNQILNRIQLLSNKFPC